MLKAIVEFRTVCAGGYAPNLDGCPICGKSESESFILDYIGGAIYCGDCKNSFSAPHAKLNPSVLSALRYIMMSPVDKLFSFSLSDENFALLSEITEGYAINQLQRRFSALDFYKTASAL